jgi:hypothetical protein
MPQKYFVNERKKTLMLKNLPIKYQIADIDHHIKNILNKFITILIEQD